MKLQELYEIERKRDLERVKQPSFAWLWIERVAAITRRSPLTVKQWLHCKQVPDDMTIDILAKHFKCKPDELFDRSNR